MCANGCKFDSYKYTILINGDWTYMYMYLAWLSLWPRYMYCKHCAFNFIRKMDGVCKSQRLQGTRYTGMEWGSIALNNIGKWLYWYALFNKLWFHFGSFVLSWVFKPKKKICLVTSKFSLKNTIQTPTHRTHHRHAWNKRIIEN